MKSKLYVVIQKSQNVKKLLGYKVFKYIFFFKTLFYNDLKPCKIKVFKNSNIFWNNDCLKLITQYNIILSKALETSELEIICKYYNIFITCILCKIVFNSKFLNLFRFL